jgi:hypothetical protein
MLHAFAIFVLVYLVAGGIGLGIILWFDKQENKHD